MKKLSLLFTATIMIVASTVKAQHDVDINATGIFYKNFGIDYEYIVKDQIGAGLSFTYAQTPLGISLDDGVDYTSMDIVPEFKFYPNPSNGGDKFYFGAYLKYKSSTWADMRYTVGVIEKKYDLNFSGVAVGLQAGYKLIFPSGLFLEGSVGSGRFITSNWSDSADSLLELSSDENNTYSDSFMFNWDLRFALAIGWRFGGE